MLVDKQGEEERHRAEKPGQHSLQRLLSERRDGTA